jgi:hypothetical protein
LKPKSAFELYSNDLRNVIIVQNRKACQEGSWEPEKALAQGWQALDEGQKEEFQRRYEALKKGWDAEKEGTGNGAGESRDEDVEMGDGEEDVGADGSGFIAVN